MLLKLLVGLGVLLLVVGWGSVLERFLRTRHIIQLPENSMLRHAARTHIRDCVFDMVLITVFLVVVLQWLAKEVA